jgi:heme A synthase
VAEVRFSLIQTVALGLTVCIFTTMVMGAYVKAIGAGMACPEWGTCRDGQVFPMDAAGVAAEVLHRIAATGVIVLGLALLALEIKDHRQERRLIALTLLAAAVVGVQVFLGALTIWSNLSPMVVTAHQATATVAFALSIVIAQRVWNLPRAIPGQAAESVAPAEGSESG